MASVSIQPIRPRFKMEMLTSDELKQIKGATLQILQEVGVHFPSDRALGIFVAHGAVVDDVNQIDRIPEDLDISAPMAVAFTLRILRLARFDLRIRKMSPKWPVSQITFPPSPSTGQS